MKPEPVAKKEPPVEPEEIEKEVPEEPKEKEDIEEESPEETTEEEKEEIKKQNELLIQNEKELIEKLLDNPSVQIEIKRIGQSELFYEYDCVNKKLFVNGVFIEEHIDELDIIKEVLKNVIK
jgi:flagellar biosynthesis GTPase FlhF